ncbi:MAG: hypothetical protein ACI8PZ_002892 [Myxococcota bacterium]|jgi:hypothetical protein
MRSAVLAAMLLLACGGKEEPIDTGSYDPAADPDDDGLSNEEEEALGTDPKNPDSDGDGVTDGREVNSNTDPLDADDKPYEGGWKIGACRDRVVPSGDAVGEVSEDFALEDRYGDMIQLHAFCDRVVLVAAMHITPGDLDEATADAVADELIALWDEYERDGLMILWLVGPNFEDTAATIEDIAAFADFQGIEFPILLDTDWNVARRFTGGPDPQPPTYTLFGEGVKIAVIDQPLDPNEVTNLLDQL